MGYSPGAVADAVAPTAMWAVENKKYFQSEGYAAQLESTIWKAMAWTEIAII
jgi:hypothetical protein